jgi:hypothetical protein
MVKDTIEDKVMILYWCMCDLANGLLEGIEMSSKISTDDLLRRFLTMKLPTVGCNSTPPARKCALSGAVGIASAFAEGDIFDR